MNGTRLFKIEFKEFYLVSCGKYIVNDDNDENIAFCENDIILSWR